MKIIKTEFEIKTIVQEYAKFQKVMLLFDNSSSFIETEKLHELIKEDCVFNQQHVNRLDYNELYNGYRLLIIMLSADSLLNLNINFGEFVCIFYSTDQTLLPYVITRGQNFDGNEKYINFRRSIDLPLYSSVCFGKFYNALGALMSVDADLEYIADSEEVYGFCVRNFHKELKELSADFKFVDLELIKCQHIDYKDLALVDLIIIDAFITLINAVKMRALSLADIYKEHREDQEKTDKFYKMATSDFFIQVLDLNYDFLINLCNQAKQQIMVALKSCQLDDELIVSLLEKVKKHCQNCDNFLSYLYLYGVFDN